MLVFTAIRTQHFLSQTFPPDQQYISYLALAAFDVGVLGWLYYATNGASGIQQRVIAYGMIFICAGGVLACTIADMMLVSNKNGLTTKIPPDMATIALWAVIIVICLNVLSGILIHLCDPSHQRHMATEAARDTIHAASLSAVSQRAGEIAPMIAERVAGAWADQITMELLGHMPAGTGSQAQKILSSKTVESESVKVTEDKKKA